MFHINDFNFKLKYNLLKTKYMFCAHDSKEYEKTDLRLIPLKW